MGAIANAFTAAFRAFNTDGVPASGAHKPAKPDIQSLGNLIETAIVSIAQATAATVFYPTRAALYGDLAHDAGTIAMVYLDPNQLFSGFYVKSGASGSGAWTLTDMAYSATLATVVAAVQPMVDIATAAASTATEAAENAAADVATSLQPLVDTATEAATEATDAADRAEEILEEILANPLEKLMEVLNEAGATSSFDFLVGVKDGQFRRIDESFVAPAAHAYDSVPTGGIVSITVLDETEFDVHDGYGVNGNGFVAAVVIKGLSVGGTVDATKLTSLVVSDPGYDGTGSVVTRTRTLFGHSILRRQTGNTGKMIFQQGSDVIVYIALSDYLFRGSKIVSATFSAGFYTGSSAGAPAAIYNHSNLAYRKPAFASLQIPNLLAGSGGLYSEVVAYHRSAMLGRQVACVEAFDRDSSGHITPSVFTATPILSTLCTQGLPPECYAHQINPAPLTQGDLCFRNFRVYPWIGDKTAILDLAVDGLQTGNVDVTIPQSQTRLRYVNDKAGTLKTYAYVNPSIAYTASASSSFNASFLPANAFDGLTTTGNGWISVDEADPWIAMHFPATVSLREIVVYPGNDLSQAPASLIAEFSDDGSTWTARGSAFTFASWAAGIPQTMDLGSGAPAHAYWRVRRPGGTTAVSIRELRMAVTAGGAQAVNGLATSSFTAARGLPFATVNYAIFGILAANTIAGRANIAGGVVRLMDDGAGGAVDHALTSFPSVDSVAVGNAWLTIEVDPSNTAAARWTATGNNQIPNKVRFSNVPIKGSAFTLAYTSLLDADRPKIAWDGCTFDLSAQGSFGWNFNFTLQWMRNCTQTGGSGAGYQSICKPYDKCANVLFMGCIANGVTQEHSFDHPPHAMIGNDLYRARVGGDQPAISTESLDGLVWANNKHSKITAGVALETSISTNRTAAVVQCLYEGSDTNPDGGVVIMNICADGTFGDIYDVVQHHTLILGERGSKCYSTDTENRGSYKMINIRYCVSDFWNIKTENLPTHETPGGAGNWGCWYNSGNRGNVNIQGGTDLTTVPDNVGYGYLGGYWGPDSTPYTGKPAFIAAVVNAQSRGYNTGTGLGDYTPVSGSTILNGRVPAGMTSLKYDLAGALRKTDGTGAAGPLEHQ